MHTYRNFLFCTSAVLAAFSGTASAHQHFAAGVTNTGQLTFVTGALSGSVYHMYPETKPLYNGWISLNQQIRQQNPDDYFSFTALSDGREEAAQPGHASTGADIWVEITSVTGPAGASFGFWESAWADDHNTPTRSFLTNTSTGGFRLQISEPLDYREPEEQDPYGHIHERGWTVTQPGDYYVGFTLYDLSTVGPGGTPLHTPSQTYIFHFQAVPEPGTALLLAAGFLPCALRPRRTPTQNTVIAH